MDHHQDELNYCHAIERCADTLFSTTSIQQQPQHHHLHHDYEHYHPPGYDGGGETIINDNENEILIHFLLNLLQQPSQQQHRYLFEQTNEGESRGYADDATWILTASFVILTMQSGFGLLEAGSCSPGYEINVMMKNIVDVIFSALAFYLVGYGIAFGRPDNPMLGLGDYPADGGYDEVQSGLLYSRYVFQLSFAATATTIVSGCVAMRMKFSVYILFSFVSTIFYSFGAHWLFTDSGWLNQLGAHDFAGGASVHIFGGMNGLIAILFLGPRQGRFDGTRPISDFFPSSPTSQVRYIYIMSVLCVFVVVKSQTSSYLLYYPITSTAFWSLYVMVGLDRI